jgi:cytochrome P450
MSSSIAEQIDEFMVRLNKLADGKTVLQMNDQAFMYTIGVLTSVAFGNISKENQDYFSSQSLISDVIGIFQFMLSRTLFPLPSCFWRFSPDNHEVEASKAGTRFSEHCLSVINEKKKAPVTALPSSNHRTCLLDKLISNQSAGEAPLSTKDLLSNVQIFFLAGTETASTTITWCLYHLCVDKSLQKALQKEVDEVLSLNMTGTFLGLFCPLVMLFWLGLSVYVCL